MKLFEYTGWTKMYFLYSSFKNIPFLYSQRVSCLLVSLFTHSLILPALGSVQDLSSLTQDQTPALAVEARSPDNWIVRKQTCCLCAVHFWEEQGYGKREMQLSWRREWERKLKAKSAISQHPSASTRSPSSPTSQLHIPAQTLAFPSTLKGLCSQKLPLWAWVAGCSLLETSEKSCPLVCPSTPEQTWAGTCQSLACFQ